MTYFKKILIANRGEIARRIIRTCNSLGIETVAIYSDADADTPYVTEASEAHHVGASQANQSYLNIDKIIQVAKETGAEAVHPGYGFLSENTKFTKHCEEAGILFIGPDSEKIQLMGDKIEARRHMEKAGVPVVPGWDGKLESVEHALEVAEDLGYPLMLKASAGGGGIGMHVVRNEEELTKSFSSAKQTAGASFGDDTVFLERFIEHARHIEVQVAADNHGNTVHLFERECSIQRRNQKVIEESPSPFLDEALRKKLCETAVKGVKEIGYTNVGTMEFIFDDESGHFYFLEMNTRLQVEHPVTEEITGLDLVELQLKIAAGQEIGLTQEDITNNGYAIEARLYAEDPETYFPSPGKLTTLKLPENTGRFDFAYEEGNTVSPFYDPMVGKIIVHGKNRKEALDELDIIVDRIEVEGITTNLSLIKQLVNENDFRDGRYTTNYLQTRKAGEGTTK
ncbi:acetyl-CoA carboxylase biotin carboxylase subunit [Halobacillus sp. A1]|uniref:acetyl-CoA carboxylase biotin carboxylase subunit n=1 Tax=Halobacillus sp. A1 TaxID=2880262 RepID=UPI0020A6851D|nr:acetyl-CoA carboxylase biotin carboxylase subunit [Halobacillus sp. A1]MCP3029805.1 acetyl-CoA carboxylase biotin carboxylase subunit [Halobacillus sp. A1]